MKKVVCLYPLKGTCQENNIPRQESLFFLQVRAIHRLPRRSLCIHVFFLSCGSRIFSAPCTHRDRRFYSSSRKLSVPCQSTWYHRNGGSKPTLCLAHGKGGSDAGRSSRLCNTNLYRATSFPHRSFPMGFVFMGEERGCQLGAWL